MKEGSDHGDPAMKCRDSQNLNWKRLFTDYLAPPLHLTGEETTTEK